MLDTNIISELMKPRPEPKVEAWLAAQRPADCFLSAVTEAELRYGIEIMSAGKRRQELQLALAGMLEQDFAGRILSFDSAAASAYAIIAGDRKRLGREFSQMDAQIATIARIASATVATRNVTDFDDCGIAVVNPWIA